MSKNKHKNNNSTDSNIITEDIKIQYEESFANDNIVEEKEHKPFSQAIKQSLPFTVPTDKGAMDPPTEDLYNIIEFFSHHVGKSVIPWDVAGELFRLYNEHFHQSEWDYKCSSCMSRVVEAIMPLFRANEYIIQNNITKEMILEYNVIYKNKLNYLISIQ